MCKCDNHIWHIIACFEGGFYSFTFLFVQNIGVE